jgi:hypothetical protein
MQQINQNLQIREKINLLLVHLQDYSRDLVQKRNKLMIKKVEI